MQTQLKTEGEISGTSGDDRAQSANTQQLSAKEGVALFEILVLTYPDLVARLQTPKRTLERLVSKNQIPHKRLGKQVRFYWPDIVDWLRNQNGAKRK